MSIKKPTIFISVEIKSREFIPKCFLSYYLIKKGFRVYLGSNLTINLALKKSDPSIILHKSTWERNSTHFKNLGHKFVIMDEEGGITTPRSLIKKYCKRRYESISKDTIDLIFFPSDRFFKNVKKLPNSKGIKLLKTGWPRVDLWNSSYEYLYENQIKKIKNKYGNFYLFISSFGMTSSRSYKSRIKNLNLAIKKKRFHSSFIMLKNNIFLLKRLSKLMNKDEKIILRPHPNESIKEWQTTFYKYKNILIIRDDDITPWLYAAESLLQAGSTTTTQAALLGKNSIIYDIKKEKGMTDTPSYELCKNVKTPEQVYKLLQKNKGKQNIKLSEFTKKLLKKEMMYDEKKPASLRISEELSKLNVGFAREFSSNFIDKIKISIDITKKYLINNFFNFFLLLPAKYYIPKKYFTSDKLKGDLDSKEVKNFLTLLQRKKKRKLNFRCKNIIKNLILIEKI